MPYDLAIRRPPGAITLADNAQWDSRFEIQSETSDRVYVVARNKASGRWACSCPAWISRRYCKHLLDGCGLSPNQIHGNGQLAAPRKRKALY